MRVMKRLGSIRALCGGVAFGCLVAGAGCMHEMRCTSPYFDGLVWAVINVILGGLCVDERDYDCDWLVLFHRARVGINAAIGTFPPFALSGLYLRFFA